MVALICLCVIVAVGLLVPATRATSVQRRRSAKRPTLLRIRRRKKSSEMSPLQASIFIERFALCVSAGLSTTQSLQRSCSVAPATLKHDVESVLAAIALGQSVESSLSELANAQPHLSAFVGIVMRSHRSGAALAHNIDSLTEFTRQAITSDVTRRIRSVGVKAVLPLGLCFLPAFVLVAVVPVISGLIKNLT